MDWFPSNLAHLIKIHKLIAVDVAKIVDSSDGTISNWRKNVSKPRFSEILKLLEYFDLTFENLFLTDLSESNLIENLNDLEIHNASEPQTDYEKAGEFVVKEIYVPMKCSITGGSCYGDRLTDTERELAALKAELAALKKKQKKK